MGLVYNKKHLIFAPPIIVHNDRQLRRVSQFRAEVINSQLLTLWIGLLLMVYYCNAIYS